MLIIKSHMYVQAKTTTQPFIPCSMQLVSIVLLYDVYSPIFGTISDLRSQYIVTYILTYEWVHVG